LVQLAPEDALYLILSHSTTTTTSRFCSFFENFWIILKFLFFNHLIRVAFIFFKILKLSWFHKLFNCK
jgi:hypothetical protein